MKTSIGFLLFTLMCSSFWYPAYLFDSKKLIGIWTYSDYEDEVITFKKTTKFSDDNWGIQFKSNGVLVKHQNVGWCGTPPITYGNFDGTWERISDSTVKIVYEYWGGMAEEELQIIELTPTVLKFKRTEYKTYEEE